MRGPKRRRQRQPLFVQLGTLVFSHLRLFLLPSLPVVVVAVAATVPTVAATVPTVPTVAASVVVVLLDPDPQQQAVVHDVQFPQQRTVQCQLLLQDLRVERIQLHPVPSIKTLLVEIQIFQRHVPFLAQVFLFRDPSVPHTAFQVVRLFHRQRRLDDVGHYQQAGRGGEPEDEDSGGEVCV
mgnify:CR=1 FL=1